jgi:hypothetical protein
VLDFFWLLSFPRTSYLTFIYILRTSFESLSRSYTSSYFLLHYFKPYLPLRSCSNPESTKTKRNAALQLQGPLGRGDLNPNSHDPADAPVQSCP